tara:strand:+ start:109 stop:618 length:510 start_codon:yes stop_codon:yes gene_type:complete
MKKITLSESQLIEAIQKAIKEDAGKDTPGGNPDYFYGDGSLDKLRNKNQGGELSTKETIKILWEIKRLLYERAPSIAMRRVTELIGKLGGDISRERDYPEAREGEDDWDGTQEHKDYLMTNPWEREVEYISNDEMDDLEMDAEVENLDEQTTKKIKLTEAQLSRILKHI